MTKVQGIARENDASPFIVLQIIGMIFNVMCVVVQLRFDSWRGWNNLGRCASLEKKRVQDGYKWERQEYSNVPGIGAEND